MLGRTKTILALLIATAVGCSSKTPTVPNPFDTADRVPPPMLQAGPGGDSTYYSQAAPSFSPAQGGFAAPPQSTFAPGQTTPSGYPAAPLQGGSTYPPAGGFPSTPAPGSATPNYGNPGFGGSASKPSRSTGAIAQGDSIRIPSDSGSLRFASPSELTLARRSSEPVGRGGESTSLAATPVRPRRAATANGWIAGSAPIRSSWPAAAPRVRMPSDGSFHEPVSLAALDGGVSVRPLEPVPADARNGEPAPLRIAQPPRDTGWR